VAHHTSTVIVGMELFQLMPVDMRGLCLTASFLTRQYHSYATHVTYVEGRTMGKVWDNSKFVRNFKVCKISCR